MNDNCKYKFAVLLSSYKRPSDLIKQVYAMLDQSYDKSYYHIFVAVKGLTEYFVNRLIYPLFSKYIEEGRLTIRYFPNKNQISNIVDCIRDIDIKDYDYFLKIDDDDFYSNDYLKLINEFLQQINDDVLYNVWFRDAEFLTANNNAFCSYEENASFYSATAVISKSVFNKFISFEYKGGNQQDDWFLKELLDKENLKFINEFLEEKKVHNFFVRNNTTASTTRNKARYMDGIGITGNFIEEFLHVIHKGWKDTIKICYGGGHRAINKDRFIILEYKPDSYLKLHWSRWGVEEFIKHKDGAWYLKDIVPS